MGTFYGGEQLVRVIRLQDSQAGVNSAATFYTVPSGRYAEIYIIYASVADVADGSLVIDYANSGINKDTDQSTLPDPNVPFQLHAGDAYKYVHNTGFNAYTYVVTIKEYLLP